MAAHDYDVLVIGAGPAGYVAAIRAAQLGLATACVDSRETLGGTCLNVGCIPSKALLHAAELYGQAASGALTRAGVRFEGLSLDLAAVHQSRIEAIAGLTAGVASLFKKNKVAWLRGQAAFVSEDTVAVEGRQIRARSIIIATGASASPLAGVEVDGERIVDSTGALEFPDVPRHLVVIGGGVIGLELGSAWRRFGAQVTVVEFLDDLLPGMDADIRKEASKMLRKQGLEIRTGVRVVAAESSGGDVRLTLEPAAGGDQTVLVASRVLVAVGRRPNTEGLNLSAAKVACDSAGRIPVDANFRTATPGLYAIGDVISGPMLAHKAEDEGVAVAEIIAGLPGMVNHAVIPSVVYTTPEIAGVGLTEEQAKAQGPVKVGRFPMLANSRAKANKEPDGFVKVIADAASDRVLGVWIIAHPAGTMIAQAAQAMEFGATSEDIAYTCHAHPTHSEAIKEAAMAVRGKALHV